MRSEPDEKSGAMLHMQEMGDWITNLKMAMGSYTVSEQRCAEYLLEIAETDEGEQELEEMTLRKMAQAAEVGQPTVVRMLTKAGYSSWNTFVRDVWKGRGAHKSLRKDQESAALRALYADLQAIEEMASHLNKKELTQIAQKLKKAHLIDIYGTDNSAGAASELSGKLLHMGLPSRNYLDLFYQKVSAGHLGNMDVAVGFSMSGETKAVVDALCAARESQATTIAVTGNRQSPLALAADFVVYTPTVVLSQSSRWISSRITQNVFVDVICAVIMERDMGYFSQNLEQSISGFRKDVSGTLRSIAP